MQSLICTLTILFFYWFHLSSSASAPLIQLSDGTKLRGSVEGSISTFKGVPFAEAPVGERRWTPPVAWTNPSPEEEWDATKFGHTCIQWLWGDDGLFDEGDEDCLFLNVYVNLDYSLRNESEMLPVAIFVHGGSYITGGTAIPLYDGVDMVEFWEGKVILVTTNYRLNAFGFLGSEELRAGDKVHGSTGNYGLQDQRLAFDWVRRNIESFGGDASHVTIFGESAGAGSMSNHLVAHNSWGLYHAVAMESGSFAEWASVSMSCAQSNYDLLLKHTGCDTPQCLKRVPAKLIRDIAGGNYNTCDYGPVVDGVELTTHPWIALTNGDVADVPILHGTNADEGSLFTILSHHASEEQLLDYWKANGYSDTEIEELLLLYVDGKVYPDSALNNSLFWWAGQRSLGDDAMSCPAKHASQEISKLISSDNHKSSVFLYHFEHLPRQQYLARHVSELEFVFHQQELLAASRDRAMADVMATYWGNFFCSFDPNIKSVGLNDIHEWLPYNNLYDNLLVLAESDDLKMASNVKKAECDFAIPRLDSIIKSEFGERT